MPAPTNAKNIVSVSLDKPTQLKLQQVMDEDHLDRSKVVRRALNVYFSLRRGAKVGQMAGIASREDKILHTEVVII
jgi:metal-responsive CopG/Arc/MetJ family transcriptional regulator